MTFEPPESFNLADHLLDARVREGRGGRTAVITAEERLSYAEVQRLAHRWAHALAAAGLEPEQRVLLALPDGPAFVGAFFGALELGAVVVMANPALPPDDARAMLDYTRARVVATHRDGPGGFDLAAREAPLVKSVIVAGTPGFDAALARQPDRYATFPSHRDDAAIWLFSGGTTGRPKAVVQTHRSFAWTTECYGRGVLGMREDDVTLSVPKLYFGYATGCNLLFPFSVGAACVLWPEPPNAESVFDQIRRHRPTVLVNGPTLIHKMAAHPDAAKQDLSCLRVCTSAGEALPAELYERWKRAFGVELLDGLGTAEMWHIFISNRIGAVRPGTIGQVVPGFEVRVCDDDGRPVPDGETGWLWVRGGARAIGYWQHQDKTEQAFRGEWYVSGDLVTRDRDGYFTYCGRGDEMLKVSGRWLVPAEVEGCLLQHPAVAEACVVGVTGADGLTKPLAYVVCRERRDGLEDELRAFVRERLDAYKHPRRVVFMDALPRTHLGKVDRGRLRQLAREPSPDAQETSPEAREPSPGAQDSSPDARERVAPKGGAA